MGARWLSRPAAPNRCGANPHIRESEHRALHAQQLILWLAARPALPPSGGAGSSELEAVAQGRNAFSSLYLAQMQLIWDKGDAREKKIASEQLKRPIRDRRVGRLGLRPGRDARAAQAVLQADNVLALDDGRAARGCQERGD